MIKTHRRVLLPLILFLAVPVAFAASDLRNQTERLRDAEGAAVADAPLYSGRLLAEFYAERDYRNAWTRAQAQAMLELAESSRADGLDPGDFHATAIRRLLDRADLASADDAVRTRADILLSDALLRYLHHLQYGKYNPAHINRGRTFVGAADAEKLKAEMERTVSAGDLAAAVRGMLPRAPFYDNLKRGYQRYLDIADGGGWANIPGGVNLTAGMRDPRVTLIRERLAVTDGFDASSDTDPHLYDDALVEAVKGFQGRSGLSRDGVIGPNTLRALNHPLDDRLASIRANLERMRWLYHDLPPDYVFVDVAAFRLEVVRDYEPVWTTRTVVGTVNDQTPMFRDAMEYIVFNPTWSVPQSIQKKMGRVSGKYQVVDRRTGRRVNVSDVSNVARYRVVQPAGPGNALGRVKFIFPNGHAIYLHDTPSRYLFDRGTRAYSHGCIRVQEPLTLAQQILNKPNWDSSEINRVVRRGQTRYVHLDDDLQVLIYYLTAMADDRGRVGFRRDIYGRDRPLLAVLGQPADAARIAFREPEPEAPPVVAGDGSTQQAGAEVSPAAADSEAAKPATDAGGRSAAAPAVADSAGAAAARADRSVEAAPPASGGNSEPRAGVAGDAMTAAVPEAAAPPAAPPSAAAPDEAAPAAVDPPAPPDIPRAAAAVDDAGPRQPGPINETASTRAPAMDDTAVRDDIASAPPAAEEGNASARLPAPITPEEARPDAAAQPPATPAVSDQGRTRSRATAPRPARPSRPFIDEELFGPPSG